VEVLVRTVNGENPKRYMDGDAVVCKPDGWQWGRCESLKVWLSEGLPENEWPGGFVILVLPGMDQETASGLEKDSLVELDARREKSIDYRSMERRDINDPRATLYSEKHITRTWSEVSSLVSVKEASTLDVTEQLVLP